MTEDGLGAPSQETFKETGRGMGEEERKPKISNQTTSPPAAPASAGPTTIFKQTSVQAFVKQTAENLPEKQNWDWNQIYGLCGEYEQKLSLTSHFSFTQQCTIPV